MKMWLALPLLAGASLTLPACAELLAAVWIPPSHDPASVPSGIYTIEPLHTQVLFSVLHFGLTNYYGNFSQATGSLAFTPQTPDAMAVSVSVPVATVKTTSAKLDETLKSADWLDAAKYPAMTFTSTKVSRAGTGSADIAGTLTLHGVSRPVTLHATFNAGGVNPLSGRETLGFQISGTIKRSAFGVAKDVPLVGDEVTLMITAAFAT